MTVETSICDFVRSYAASKPLRAHMPGHKGKAILGPEPLDITEIEGADVLYQEEGILRQSQENAAKLFGSAKTLYSCEGSSLCLRAMLYLSALHASSRGKRPKIAVGRNAHKVFVLTAALLDIDLCWLYPEKDESINSCSFSLRELEALFKSKEAPTAVYVTSPDYLGHLTPLSPIAALCRKYGALLLVDNAHGAYLNFLPGKLHPLRQGADLCCDSAHKTLPVLTGGAYLHLSNNVPIELLEAAERAMQLFASTSPSYLILQSLDAVNARLASDYPARLQACAERVNALREAVSWPCLAEEPLKLCLLPKARGYTGHELSALLQKQGIVSEFSDPDHLVLMFSPELSEEEFTRLETVLDSIKVREPITNKPPKVCRGEAVLRPHEALFLAQRTLPVNEALGKVLAIPTVSCPPAIPIVVCGERISPEAVEAFRYYGIERCTVLEDRTCQSSLRHV